MLQRGTDDEELTIRTTVRLFFFFNNAIVINILIVIIIIIIINIVIIIYNYCYLMLFLSQIKVTFDIFHRKKS